MAKFEIQYWDKIDYYSGSSEVKKIETWEGDKEEIFKRFYEENNRLRYCNGSYYKFQDENLQAEYRNWYDSLSENVKFHMYYGNGVVD